MTAVFGSSPRTVLAGIGAAAGAGALALRGVVEVAAIRPESTTTLGVPLSDGVGGCDWSACSEALHAASAKTIRKVRRI